MKLLIRKIFLTLLKNSKFDFHIVHHLTKFKFFLNSYTHKGYWFYGKKRELNTVNEFKRLIKDGDTIIEIGGHIGYFSTYFARLVGSNGRVFVFEPSKSNLSYLHRNISLLPNDLKIIVDVIEKGAGSVNESLEFYLDPITGQNNSFVKDFDGFLINKKFQAESTIEVVSTIVDVIRLDDFVNDSNLIPNFVKIDVEGFELQVLNGFSNTLSKFRPKLMVEIQKDELEIFNLFQHLNYSIFNDRSEKLINFETFSLNRTPNIFFIPN
jgi:FkbM family methyltransferase